MMYFIGGDWKYFWPGTIKDLVNFPLAWDSFLNTGGGMPSMQTLWINSYLSFTSLFIKIGFSWNAISIIFWFLPIIAIGFFSSRLLFKQLFPNKPLVSILSGVVYIFNTYFLLVFSGGQMGVAFGYSFMPLVLFCFFKLLKKQNIHNAILLGISLSLITLFDIRLLIISFIIIAIIFSANLRETFTTKFFFLIFISISLVIMLHSYWILPLLLFPVHSLPPGFESNVNIVNFLSFADFPRTFSLLHPNWPDNIFGMTYFLQPEFLFIPILAFSSLLFVLERKTKKIILSFSFIALLGAFLSKGTQYPLGNIYFWMITHVPGFIFFRDPTKFYILIAISYAILIPFTLDSLFSIYSKIRKNEFIKKTFLIFFIFFWFLLLRQFHFYTIFPKTVSNDYVLLENILSSDKSFSRTLWIPSLQRFGYFSLLHPAIGRGEVSLKDLQSEQGEKILRDFDIEYIILPSDPEKEIYLKDRKFNSKIYQDYLSEIEKIPYVHLFKRIGNIQIFVPNFKINDHLSLFGPGKIKYIQQDQTSYKLMLKNVSSQTKLIFSELYDQYWNLNFPEKKVLPQKSDKIMEFSLKEGTYSAQLFYSPQVWVNVGLIISICTLIIVVIILFVVR